MVPPEQLLCIKLEDGLDWDAICPFLEVPTPDVPWPKNHTADEFSKRVARSMAPHTKDAFQKMAICGAVAAGAVAIGVWWIMRRQ